MKAAVYVCALTFSLYGGDTSGSLAGRVLDISGAGIADAAVAVSAQASAGAATAVTDREGRYVIFPLTPGTYAVTVSAAGFARHQSAAVEIRPGQRAVLDVTLAIATLIESMSVRAKAPASEGAFETRPHNTREVLEIREVRESAAKDVGEALAGLDGVWKIRKGGVANDVVLRGFQQGNIAVLINGARIHGACPNHMDPSAFHVDFAEVETVQVTKGPFDIRNQGSLGGSVNIVTKSRADGLHITPNFSAGSFGFYNPSIDASYSSGAWSASGGYSHRRSELYRDGNGRRISEYANYSAAGRSTDAFDVGTGWGDFGVVLPRNQRLTFSYTRQQGGLTLYPYLMMDALFDNADRAGVSWVAREWSPLLRRIEVQGYFTRVRHWMTDELRVSSASLARPYSMATFAGTRTWGGRVEAELPGTLVGIESYRRGWDAVNTIRMLGMYVDQASIPGVQMSVNGAYAQHRRTLGRLELTLGGRIDAAVTRAHPNALNRALYHAYQNTRTDSNTDAGPSGTVWGAYRLAEGVELFAGAATVMRPPDAQERYFALKRGGSDWVGNPDLALVRNNELDAGVNIRARRVSFRPTVFYSRLSDYVTLYSQPKLNSAEGVVNGAARSYANVPARVYGGEVSYGLSLSRALLLAGGASYTRGYRLAGARVPVVADLAEMPPLKTRLSLRYGQRSFFVEAEGRAAASQTRVDWQLLEQRSPGYALFGLRGGMHRGPLNFAAGIDNVFDRFYYEHLSYQRDPFRTAVRVPDPGRTLYVSVSWVFE